MVEARLAILGPCYSPSQAGTVHVDINPKWRPMTAESDEGANDHVDYHFEHGISRL